MPILAAIIGNIAGWIAAILGKRFAFDVALRAGSYTAWILVTTTFLSTVLVCVSSLFGMMQGVVGQGGGWVHYLWVGLGMFIPQNAGAIVSCIASVWIATSLWKIKRIGIENFSK